VSRRWDTGHLLSQSDVVPMSPDVTEPPLELVAGNLHTRDDAQQVVSEKFAVDAASTYSLAELIDLAESQVTPRRADTAPEPMS
jgi:hypothetical protein